MKNDRSSSVGYGKRGSHCIFLLITILAITSSGVVSAQGIPTVDVDGLKEKQRLLADTLQTTMPEFVGGEEKMFEFLSDHMDCQSAFLAGVQGIIDVTFVIERDGSVSSVNLINGVGHGCDEQALAAIASMPKWRPGTENGKVIKVQYRMPIRIGYQ